MGHAHAEIYVPGEEVTLTRRNRSAKEAVRAETNDNPILHIQMGKEEKAKGKITDPKVVILKETQRRAPLRKVQPEKNREGNLPLAKRCALLALPGLPPGNARKRNSATFGTSPNAPS